MVRRLIRLSDHRCTCISNVRICLEKGLILIKNVKVSTLGLRLHLRKTKQGGGQACEKTQQWAGLLGGVARFTEPRKKLRCAAPLMREQLGERMMCVRNISDIQIHNSGYWNQRHQTATCRYREMKGRASRRIFQPLQLLIHGFCTPLCQPSVMSACVHWGLQLAHQTHSSRESTLPLQSPFLAFRSPGSSKETGNL